MNSNDLKEILRKHKIWTTADKNNPEGQRADLRGSNLRGCDLRDSNLRGCNLRGCDLRGSNLRGCDLRDSDLRGCDLSGCDLRGCDLSDSDLRGSDLRGSNLRGCDLSDSNLRDSNLRGCDLRDSNLRGCDLSGCAGIIHIQSSYPYQSYGFKFNDKNYIRLGCHCRTIEEWDADFNNNPSEFPEGSSQMKVRKFIYECMKNWLLNNY